MNCKACRRQSMKPEEDGVESKGRILKIKTGYNPNSSSIGVDVIAFFTAGAALTVLFNTLAAVISASNAMKHGRPGEPREAPALSRAEEQR